jgi:hypothetical protein
MWDMLWMLLFTKEAQVKQARKEEQRKQPK